jgi:DNA helicase-2/ATP-dependent DNA helicase PcrA
MDITELKPFEQIIQCLNDKRCFVLQGGAGSGKTETLKQVISHLSNDENVKISCITHTNKAVDEIKERVGDVQTICTIHSFLNSLIKDYKRNIHTIIHKLFLIDLFEEYSAQVVPDEKERMKLNHDRYKKIYLKYSSKQFLLNEIKLDKVIGKRDYDKSPSTYNDELNKGISELNQQIKKDIEQKDFTKIRYNETIFDDYQDITFGHDSLLRIFCLLVNEFPLLKKIILDKYDYIFIDEYQDTSSNVVSIFLNDIVPESSLVIGLFGDSMQGIYSDGIGEVNNYIKEKKLVKIEKEDNYRCSKQVIDFINQLRNDGLKQKVAFKESEKDISERQGNVKFVYAIYDSDKPSSRSPEEDKERYLEKLNTLISIAGNGQSDFKTLMLTNKSIALEVGFKNLYEIFNARYRDINEVVERTFSKLQLNELCDICRAYEQKQYNEVILILKRNGYTIKRQVDKTNVIEIINSIIDSKESAIDTLTNAHKSKILRQTERCKDYLKLNTKFLYDLKTDNRYTTLKIKYEEGHNTFARISKEITDIDEYEFDSFINTITKEIFVTELLSDKLPFSEVLQYYRYLDETTGYITMHKTKGIGIDNTIVVLDEYFWSEYNFKSVFDSKTKDEGSQYAKNLKLVYVACSRTKKNLTCLRIILQDEEENLLKLFPDAEKMVI